MSRYCIIILLTVCANLGQADLINSLPGSPTVKFKQYAGFLTVGDNKEDNLYYMFVESQNNPVTDPIVLWLSGGPGCSSLSTLLSALGPLLVNDDGTGLYWNDYGWNLNASVIALESPAGVGFSYSTSGNLTTGDNKTAVENWEAIREFFKVFPQYANNDFYVAGASYGGVYVPTLVQTIMDRQGQYKINLKGFLIGNGAVSQQENTNTKMQFMYNHGMVDESTWQQAKSQCCNNDIDDCNWHAIDKSNTFCYDFVDDVLDIIWSGGMDPYDMYYSCVNTSINASAPDSVTRQKIERHKRYSREVNPAIFGGLPCVDSDGITTYLNRADVRKALFIPTSLPAWSTCNDDINYRLYTQEVFETAPLILSALQSGLRGILYHGDIDMVCNVLLGSRFAYKLGLPVTKKAKEYFISGQVGGFHTQYGNDFHFVTARGGSHSVPANKPDIGIYILNTFLFNNNWS